MRPGQNSISSASRTDCSRDAGASYINIPDTVGFTTPAEYGAIFKYLIDYVTQTARLSIPPIAMMT